MSIGTMPHPFEYKNVLQSLKCHYTTRAFVIGLYVEKQTKEHISSFIICAIFLGIM